MSTRLETATEVNELLIKKLKRAERLLKQYQEFAKYATEALDLDVIKFSPREYTEKILDNTDVGMYNE